MSGSIPDVSSNPLGYQGLDPTVNPPFVNADRIPTTNDVLNPGTQWQDNSQSPALIYETTGAGNWALSGSSSSDLNTLSDTANTTVTPSAGNIKIAGTANQIAITAGSHLLTASLVGPYTPATYTAHGVLIGEGTSSVVATTPGTTGQVLIGSTGADPAFGALGVNSGLTAHGVLLGENTSAIVATAAGTNGQILVAATAADPAFASLTSTGSTITVTGGANTLNIDVAAPLNVAHGGTGATTLTGVLTGNGTSAVTANAVTQHGVVLGGVSNAVSSLAVAATGTVLAGSTGADPAFTGSPSVSGSLTAATTITATLGNITATNGNLSLATAGNKIVIATGSNASVGTSSAMSGTPGAVTVATTACSATAKVFYSRNITGGTPGHVSITAQDGTGFTLTSTGNETSTFNWWIINT